MTYRHNSRIINSSLSYCLSFHGEHILR